MSFTKTTAAALVIASAAAVASADVITLTDGEFFAAYDTTPFDGVGDSGPFPYNNVIRGTTGEIRGVAEFDMSLFGVPAGHEIVSATFEVFVASDNVGGFGVSNQRPDTMTVSGFVGDGLRHVSDFQVADGNALDTVDTSNAVWQDVLSFDVTGWLSQVATQGDAWAGFVIKADTLGGLSLWPGTSGYPRLVVTTAAIPAPGSLALLGAAGLFARRRR